MHTQHCDEHLGCRCRPPVDQYVCRPPRACVLAILECQHGCCRDRGHATCGGSEVRKVREGRGARGARRAGWLHYVCARAAGADSSGTRRAGFAGAVDSRDNGGVGGQEEPGGGDARREVAAQVAAQVDDELLRRCKWLLGQHTLHRLVGAVATTTATSAAARRRRAEGAQGEHTHAPAARAGHEAHLGLTGLEHGPLQRDARTGAICTAHAQAWNARCKARCSAQCSAR